MAANFGAAMRILILTHNYPRFLADPAGAFVHRIAGAAVAAGSRVMVVAPHAAGLAESETVDGVELRRFRYAPERWERLAYTGNLHRSAAASLVHGLAVVPFLLAFRRFARRMAREFAPQVVHAHWWLPAGWVAKGLGCPYIVTSHGSDVRLLEGRALVRRLARPVYARASAVTAVSRFLARDLELLLRLPAESVRVLPMPVELAHYATGRSQEKVKPPRILYAGNLLPSKGVDVLLEAYAALRQRGVRCTLRVRGEGPAQAELEARAQALAAPDVEWLPFVPQSMMPEEYGAATVTVLPTRGQAEGLGLTLVEALAAGSAVVGTSAGGIPEVVQHEETGLLVPDGDATALAGAIERLLADPGLRNRLVSQGQARVAALFDAPAAAERYLELYDNIAHRRA